ncbi:MAG: choice-of-anchor B family protein [Caldilineaceae bacterium]
MQKYLSFPPKQLAQLLALLVVGILSIGLLAANRVVQAHDLGPLAPPQLPACRVAATTCDLSQAPQAPTPRTQSAPQAQVGRQAPDGKGWLATQSDLISYADRKLVWADPLTNVPCVNGFADVYPCHDVDLLAFLPAAQMGGDTNNDMWGWTDPVTGKEYALVGARDGVVFVDISNPTAPVYLGKLPSHGTRSAWRDLKVYQDHLFVVADLNRNHGLQVFDLTDLRTVTTTPTIFTESAHNGDFSDAHNIAINEASGYAYTVGGEQCNAGLLIFDIRDVDHPVEAGCYAEDGYIHDTECVIYHGPDQAYQGRELCFDASVDAFTIVDVTDKAAPTRLARLAIDGAVYLHQGWLTADQEYLLLDDEMDEWFGGHNTRTYILDVRDIDVPQLIGEYNGALSSVDHNLYISGTYAYEANYTSGLRILDIQDIDRGVLHEVASFDTYPENDVATTTGAWTAYPFFKSGVVAVSTIDRGLFLLKPHLTPDVVLGVVAATAEVCTTGDTAQQQFTDTLEVAVRNQYTQSVTLGVSDLPAGATATYNPTVLTPSGSEQMTSTLWVDGHALLPGIYPLTITVTSAGGQLLDTAPVHLYAAETPPSFAGLTQVEPAVDITSTAVVFTWPADASATAFHLEIARDPEFAALVQQATIRYANHYIWATQLPYNSTFYWRVQPENRCGLGLSSPVYQVHTGNALFLPLVQQ